MTDTLELYKTKITFLEIVVGNDFQEKMLRSPSLIHQHLGKYNTPRTKTYNNFFGLTNDQYISQV